MTERALALLLTLSLTLIFSSTPALSQSADDRAAAEVLFNAAVKNMEGKNFNGACPQLEESERLDPGVGTLLYLADCYENVGRTASAWATFREAAYLARSSGQSERERVANEYADRLRPQLSYLQLVVETPKTDGLEIARKSDRMKSPKAIRQVMWSTAIPLDAGTHMIIANAPGRLEWRGDVIIPKKAGTVEFTVPALADTPVVAPPPSTANKQEVQPDKKDKGTKGEPGEADEDDGGSSLPMWAWIATGTGAVFSVVGLAAMNNGKSLSEEADGLCRRDDPTICSQEGYDKGAEATQAGETGGSLLGLGAALLITGGILFYLAPSDDDEAEARSASLSLHAAAGPQGGGLMLNGAW